MAMSEKNESYLFDLLESINKTLKLIRWSIALIGITIVFGGSYIYLI